MKELLGTLICDQVCMTNN